MDVFCIGVTAQVFNPLVATCGKKAITLGVEETVVVNGLTAGGVEAYIGII